MNCRPRTPLASLPLLVGGLLIGQAGCTSQQAIAILVGDAALPGADSTVPTPDRADAPADALIPTDTLVPADALVLADVTLRPADAAAPEVQGRETTPDLTTALDGPPPTPTVLFTDGFEGGYEVNWLLSESSDGPVSDTRDGTNPIVTLDSSQTDFSRLRCNLFGDKFTAVNITASMDLRIEQPPSSTRTVRLDVRQAAATANIFYAVGAVVAIDGTLTKVSIYKKVPDGSGDYTICELAAGLQFATPIAMNQWRTIKLTVSGTSSVHLAAFFEDLQVATFTDDCVSSLTATNGATVANPGCLPDQTGLGIQVEKGLKASVDNVLVTSP